MDVRGELDRLVAQIRHLPYIIERAFERLADFSLVRLGLDELPQRHRRGRA